MVSNSFQSSKLQRVSQEDPIDGDPRDFLIPFDTKTGAWPDQSSKKGTDAISHTNREKQFPSSHFVTLGTLRDLLTDLVLDEAKNGDEVFEASGLPKEFHALSDIEFAKIVYTRAFDHRPEQMTAGPLTVLGAVPDGDNFAVVCRYETSTEDFSRYLTVGIFRKNGELKMRTVVGLTQIQTMWRDEIKRLKMASTQINGGKTTRKNQGSDEASHPSNRGATPRQSPEDPPR